MKLKEISSFDYNKLNPLQVHVAIECEDPIGFAKKLESAGAKIIGEFPKAQGINEIILVKNP